MFPRACLMLGPNVPGLFCAVVLLTWSQSAWATCGDYLQHQRGDRPVADQPLKLPVRCSGPQCHQGPLVPASPIVPDTLPLQLERWAIGDGTALAVLGAAASGTAASFDARAVAGALGEVEHVPRSV